MGNRQGKLSRDELADLKRHTHFDKDELQRQYKIFLKDCPNNELSKDGFVQIYQKAFPFGDPCEFADYIFRAFDEDDSGKISFREFICALSVTSRGSLEEKLKWAFQLYDIDRNGTIVYDELLEIVQAIYKMTGLMVEFPPDEDTPEYWASKIFNYMDRDRNENITYDELVKGSEQDPTIVQALSLADAFSP